MTNYFRFSVGFYLLVLGLTIPFYLLLYGASGHEFHLNAKDGIWMFTVVCAFILTIIYLFYKDKQRLQYQILKAGLGIFMLATLYGGFQSLIFILGFKYGSDVSIIIKGLGYIVPMIFIASNWMILLELIRGLGMKKVSAANQKNSNGWFLEVLN